MHPFKGPVAVANGLTGVNNALVKCLFITSTIMRRAGHVARMGDRRDAYRVMVVKPKGKRTLGRPWRRWEGNIKMDLQEVGCGGYGLD
jgi:hypothetical protein